MVILYCPEYQCVKCPLLSQLFNIFLKGSSWKPKTVSYMRKYPAHSHIPRAELLIQDTQWALNNYLLNDPIDERMKFWEKSLTIWYVTSRDRWEFTTYMYMYVCVCVCARTHALFYWHRSVNVSTELTAFRGDLCAIFHPYRYVTLRACLNHAISCSSL